MIEINLLPGSGKKSRKGSGPKLNFGSSFSGLRDRVRDPWLAGAIGSAVVGIGMVAALWVTQGARETRLDEELQKAARAKQRRDDETRRRRVARGLPPEPTPEELMAKQAALDNQDDGEMER